jgi:hypothetical protein
MKKTIGRPRSICEDSIKRDIKSKVDRFGLDLSG